MGALDDAIKEHLELKRKHGAAEDEVRELEQEALGPPRSTLPPVSADAQPSGSADRGTAEEPAFAPPPLPEETLETPTPLPDAPPSPAPASSQETVDFTPDFALEDDPRSRAGDEPPPPVPPVDRDAASEEELEEESDPLEDPSDVLEKTPEFLEDAPDHDRLWFEQRPPRDFDFDD